MCLPVSVPARSEQHDMTLKRDSSHPSSPFGNSAVFWRPTLSGTRLRQPQVAKKVKAA